jgi:hypothetical protein
MFITVVGGKCTLDSDTAGAPVTEDKLVLSNFNILTRRPLPLVARLKR